MKRRKENSVAPASTRKFTDLALQSCSIAKDAAFNLCEYLENSSKMAFLAIKDCEKELDQMERRIDEELPAAMAGVTEVEARELLACLKFIIDLERIGDLTWSAAQHLQALPSQLLRNDGHDLTAMADILEKMLVRVREGFVRRDLESAMWVRQTDTQIDQVCRAVFRRHLGSKDQSQRDYSTSLLLIAQAFERAGDHTKNLGEELVHLVEGRSVRHEPKRPKDQEK